VSGNQGSGDATPAWLADCRPIEVDAATLAQFAKALQDELDLNFVPHTAKIFDGLDPGTAPFHHKDGFLELQAAWVTYVDTKARTLNLVQAYANATAELAEAGRILARNYRDSDQLAAARLSDVEQALTQARQARPEGTG
jgi:hypothetical protein